MMEFVNTFSNLSILVRTSDQVRDEFSRRGISISEWARKRGYSAQLVYQILAGRKRCMRGQSHAIAVALGLKQGEIGTIEDLDQALTLEPKTTFPKEVN
jgi:gp16 family phage-associated protein